MNRNAATKLLADRLTDEVVVSNLGQATTDLQLVADRPLNYYTFGSMGQCSSIGLGIALARPDTRVVCLDGDGSLIMNLGLLCTVANVAPQGVSAGPDQQVEANSAVSFSGSFSDPGSGDTHSLAWAVVDQQGATVATGSGAAFSFTPTAAGAYTVTFRVSDDDSGSAGDSLVLTVTDGNAEAQQLYEAAGFRAIGVEPDAIRVGGNSYAKTHMYLDLR